MHKPRVCVTCKQLSTLLTNQEIVLTRVLTKQVVLYLLLVLVDIVYMS